ncbi:NAD-dependent epimerase/dehydratase family protein [Phenylobacterium kunshanense]|uniref:NAD-dependent epimerase/dehydratase family protein n=1 Tax=Phenylobacterium kunshanense TaxID=1445034 RepID=UPI0023E8F1BA|nr:SDR family NAD(P)-dependent oxidoreductase [Phenylobacterium kunshanense]
MTRGLVAVTGATGFLGRHLVRALADDGWAVRVLARRDPIDALWQDVAPQVVVGGLEDPAALARLCAGADVVVHAAGLVKARSRADFDAVNVAGSVRVAEAARDAAHVLLVSSLTAREPALSHYSASKHAGERAMSNALGDRLTIVRPCAIYGPGDRELLPVFQAAARVPVLPILDPDARICMIHVEDAARQTAALAAAPPPRRTVALSDSRPEGYGWRELMTEAARACGRSPRFAPVPKALIHTLGITNDFTALLGSTPMLTSAKARELLHPDWAISPEERMETAAPVKFDLSSGFSSTVAWYRNAAWMKH